MKINGSKILVTGGSLGIGKATAQMLVEGGADVIITGRDKNRLTSAAEETGAIPFVADVAISDDILKTYQFVREEWGRLDVLINNAGIGSQFTHLTDVNEQDFLNVYQVNVIGAAMMAKYAAQMFKEQGYGNIVNIASTAAKKGYEKGTIYASSKFALRGMTECWQAELRKYNVRVILINPSEVTTAFGNPERIERNERSNRLRSEEIAHAVKASLEMDDRGFIPELTVYATNPWEK
jgi:3-oxoacyl-[acyl-carrier protein] reductase